MVLVDLLKDHDRDLRQAAAEGLGQLGGAQAILALRRAVEDSDAGVQQVALRALKALR